VVFNQLSPRAAGLMLVFPPVGYQSTAEPHDDESMRARFVVEGILVDPDLLIRIEDQVVPFLRMGFGRRAGIMPAWDDGVLESAASSLDRASISTR
jgi:hypothetical protein